MGTSVGVGTTFESVCLSVCLFVCLFVRSITEKRIIPKCSNLVKGMTLGYPRSSIFWSSNVKGQGHRVAELWPMTVTQMEKLEAAQRAVYKFFVCGFFPFSLPFSFSLFSSLPSPSPLFPSFSPPPFPSHISPNPLRDSGDTLSFPSGRKRILEIFGNQETLVAMYFLIY